MNIFRYTFSKIRWSLQYHWSKIRKHI